MSAYSELIKNFERIRAYMREFYVYGFKSRDEYDRKSTRSYDDERRRMESWLGDHMGFVRTAEGKNMFISIDSRVVEHNPLHRAWKAKSFTDGDITLHFILLDILHDPSVALTLGDIMAELDGVYLAHASAPLTFDESTVRKKLKEYEGEGIVVVEREGRRSLYRRASDVSLPDWGDALHFFSEVLPCGVVGSFLTDGATVPDSPFGFKHHYITGTLDSDVLAVLFTAMREKRSVSLENNSRYTETPRRQELVPLRVFISTQNGRQHLLAYQPQCKRIQTYRLDFLSAPRLGEPCPVFDELRALLDELQAHMWSVNCKGHTGGTEHVEFVIRIEAGEEYIVERLEREKRCGQVEKLDGHRYRFTADVYDTSEVIPWIRTFICRIESMDFSNRTAENRFKADVKAMYRLYGIEGGDEA